MDDRQKELSAIWDLAQQVERALGDQYNPVLEAAAAKEGLVAPAWYAWLLPAVAFEPEAMSTAKLRVRSPYVAPQLYEERLSNAAAAGYLRCVDQYGYLLTVKGHQAVQVVLQAGYACMAQLTPMSIERMEELAGLLVRLVAACLATPEPPGTWCLAHSRKIDPGDGASAAARIDQYLSDLAAYRDDCHLAAWAPLGIDGPELEALTYLWRASDIAPLTLEELFEKLVRRGWEKEDYRSRLSDLIRRGWVEQAAEAYVVTRAGAEVRQEVEDRTDAYFYQPWDCLTPAKLDKLRSLLAAIGEHL
jgi:hypothetical protein